jgi:hypothetical protein
MMDFAWAQNQVPYTWEGHPTANPPALHAALAEVAADQCVLEVGTFAGASAAAMASTAKHVLTVDCFTGQAAEQVMAACWEHVRTSVATLPNVSQVYGDSRKVLPLLLATGARFGMVFIDGWHSNPILENDLKLGWELLADGGVMAADDYGASDCPDVKATVDKLFGESWRIVQDRVYPHWAGGSLWLGRKM